MIGGYFALPGDHPANGVAVAHGYRAPRVRVERFDDDVVLRVRIFPFRGQYGGDGWAVIDPLRDEYGSRAVGHALGKALAAAKKADGEVAA